MKSSSGGIRPARSLGDLTDPRRPFDVRVGYNRRKVIPPLVRSDPAPKALYVTVYRNGDPHFTGIKVSVRPGKHFLNLDGLCNYLSQRLKIPQGVRYMFRLHDGSEVTELSQLRDGEAYVASGVKTFKEAPYGKLGRLHTSTRPNAAPMRPDDMVLFKQPHHESLEGLSLPGSRESTLVTVVNRKDPSKRSRVLLNLKTRQSWEDVLKDMGQAIGIPKAGCMMTPWGEEVRSFSHLKNDFSEVETFYLDTGSKIKMPQRSNSDSNLKDVSLGSSLRIKIPNGRNLIQR